jgi:hypothetical protein
MDDDDPITREADVELESVSSKRQAVIERRDGVLGPKRRAAPMRVDERTQAINLTRGSSASALRQARLVGDSRIRDSGSAMRDSS